MIRNAADDGAAAHAARLRTRVEQLERLRPSTSVSSPTALQLVNALRPRQRIPAKMMPCDERGAELLDERW